MEYLNRAIILEYWNVLCAYGVGETPTRYDYDTGSGRADYHISAGDYREKTKRRATELGWNVVL